MHFRLGTVDCLLRSKILLSNQIKSSHFSRISSSVVSVCRAVIQLFSWLSDGTAFYYLTVGSLESWDMDHHMVRLTSHTFMLKLLIPGTLLRALITQLFQLTSIVIPVRDC